MPVATPAAVRKQIKSGSPAPLYLLLGDDDIEKSALAAEFAELVEEDLRAFNVERIHAGDMTSGDKLAEGVGALSSAVRTLPMMAPRRVVIVTQAEWLLVPKRESETATRALDRLETLFKQPEPHTTLVFVAGALDKRSRMYKLLTKQATVVESGTLEDQADAERWVRTRVAASGSEIEPAAARRLAERAGPDVKRLRGEVDRLLLYAMGQARITLDDVRQVAGPAALQDDWALTNAIEAGRCDEALRQLALMFEAGAAPEKILGQLGWLVRTKFPALAPDDLSAAVQSVFRTDVALKSSAGDPRILLERLVVELCREKRARYAGAQRR
ncbi:MAG TPA: DNA polymerase III subunit delta [Vicinamibacterales bacterium]|jgi:DNA polymerase-3 subunit delta|nr:DNA polymerase III subunit delta [Vicinamibacterales bacterium]